MRFNNSYQLIRYVNLKMFFFLQKNSLNESNTLLLFLFCKYLLYKLNKYIRVVLKELFALKSMPFTRLIRYIRIGVYGSGLILEFSKLFGFEKNSLRMGNSLPASHNSACNSKAVKRSFSLRSFVAISS